LLISKEKKRKKKRIHSNYFKNGVQQPNANTEWWETTSHCTKLTNSKPKMNRLKNQKREP